MENLRIKVKIANIYTKGILPKDLSELNNTTYFVEDEFYNHTDNNYTTEDKEKVDKIDSTIDRVTNLENRSIENNTLQLKINNDLITDVSNVKSNISNLQTDMSLVKTGLNNQQTALQDYQKISDMSLRTDAKTVVGAINELFIKHEINPDTNTVTLENGRLSAKAIESNGKIIDSSTIERIDNHLIELDTRVLEVKNKNTSLEDRLDKLEAKGGYLNSHNFNKQPTQEELNDYAYQELSSEEILNGTKVNNLFDNHTWIYISGK